MSDINVTVPNMSPMNVCVPGVPPIYVNLTPGYIGQSGYSGYSGIGFINGVTQVAHGFSVAQVVHYTVSFQNSLDRFGGDPLVESYLYHV